MVKFPSGYQALQSTESSLLKVTSDIFMTTNSGLCTVLVIVDLSAAFDMIDHNNLLIHLKCEVGIHGSVLN